MASLYDNPDLTTARDASTQATTNATNLAGQAQSLPDILHQALVQKFTDANPLYTQRESAAKNFLTTYTQAPLDYTSKTAGGNSDVIYNPAQMQNLIQARRAGALAPLTTANSQLDLATGGLGNIVDSAKNVYSGIVQKAQGDATAKRQNYEDILNETEKRQAEQQAQQELLLKKMQLGLEYGANQVPAGNQGVTLSKNPQQASLQQAYLNTTNLKLRENIAASWKQSHGTELFPTPPSGSEATTTSQTRNAMQKIQDALDLVSKKSDVGVGGLSGVINQYRLDNPNINAILPFQPNQDTKQLYDTLLQLKTLGERGQVGGRLTGYLLNQLGPSYAQLPKSKEDIIRELNGALSAAQGDLTTTAQSHGYNDYTEMPGFAGGGATNGYDAALNAIFGQ